MRKLLGRKGVWEGARTHTSQEIFDFMRPEGLTLDLGCGVCRHSDWLADKGYNVVGLDMESEHLKECKRVTAVRGDAVQLPFPDESFDGVLCCELLENLQDPQQCMEEVYRILKKGGIACFITPCSNIPIKALVSIHGKLLGPDPNRIKEHVRVFSDRKLLSMLSPYFRESDIRYTKFTIILQHRLGIGYKLDHVLSNATKKIPPLHYLAGCVSIRATKTKDA